VVEQLWACGISYLVGGARRGGSGDGRVFVGAVHDCFGWEGGKEGATDREASVWGELGDLAELAY
jgi:hypothetical protein